MKFTLKDYQDRRGRRRPRQPRSARARTSRTRQGEISSFSLTATTGAGKTVMAAAAIEALFCGNETFDFDPDPGAVVIWFSDDPNLNEQTFNRLRQASEKFTYSNLVHIEPPFAKPRLEPGKVYFLNTQKLAKSSLLTRGHVETAPDGQERISGLAAAAPDMQGWTIWETIANTIDDRRPHPLPRPRRGAPRLQHQDHVRQADDRAPARQRHEGASADPDRVGHLGDDRAVREGDGGGRRDQEPACPAAVVVDPVRVQESGLVKDTVVLDIPDEAGNFDSVLVRRAARKLKDSTERWAEYAASQGLIETRAAAPGAPDTEHAGPRRRRASRSTRSSPSIPDLRASSVRHVLGDHSTQKFGAWEVDWIEPQRVQDEPHVRVLVAKDAISTGWDCPRAEVLVSFRPAKDHTHITQLLGRMVRNPLARRVPGDERLNAVDCILPFFDRTTAGNVVRFLTGDLDDHAGRREEGGHRRQGASAEPERAAPRCGSCGRRCRRRRAAARRPAGEAARRARAGAVGRRVSAGRAQQGRGGAAPHPRRLRHALLRQARRGDPGDLGRPRQSRSRGASARRG